MPLCENEKFLARCGVDIFFYVHFCRFLRPDMTVIIGHKKMCLRWKPHKSIANPHSFFASARTKFVSTHVSEFTKSRLFIPKQSKTTIGFSFSFSRLHLTLFDTLHFQTTTILTFDHKINKKK